MKNSIKKSLIAAAMYAANFTSFTKKNELPLPKKQYEPLDLSDFVEPVNGYQVKQRKRKLRRKKKC